MSKYIKVNNCFDCLNSTRFPGYYYRCRHADNNLEDITAYESNKTIHPDCPLPDLKELIEKILKPINDIKVFDTLDSAQYRLHIIQLAIKETLEIADTAGGK